MDQLSPDTQELIAIIGAGFLGKQVCRILIRSHFRVLATTRSSADLKQFALDTSLPLDRIPILSQLDLINHDLQYIQNLLRPCSRIVVCCAPHSSPTDSGKNLRDQLRRSLYINGVQKIFQACQQLDVKRIVYTSSTSALPDIDGPINENCQEWPENDRGRIQREAETAVQEQCERLGIPWIVLRLAGLYGPGRELARLYRRHPEQILVGDGMQATNLIHRDDAAQAIVAALFLPKENCELINVCDDDHCSRRQMFQNVAKGANLSPPLWQSEPDQNCSVRGKQVDNQRMKAILGVSLIHPRHSSDESA